MTAAIAPIARQNHIPRVRRIHGLWLIHRNRGSGGAAWLGRVHRLKLGQTRIVLIVSRSPQTLTGVSGYNRRLTQVAKQIPD
jgi:hypothetical protein